MMNNKENTKDIQIVKKMPQVFFTSDLHFGHKNILKYCPGRVEKIYEWARQHGVRVTEDSIIECMDLWLVDLWNRQVSKDDTVYILGDFSFHSAEKNRKILDKLNGKKFLILGNHDGNSDKLTNWFEQITQIKEVKYKDESNETFCFELCHFPMVSWNRKEHGTIHLHGHCHGNLDGYNVTQPDLRIDVGLDGKLANYKFLTPDEILFYFYKKAGTKDFNLYAKSTRYKDPSVKKDNLITKIKNLINGRR